MAQVAERQVAETAGGRERPLTVKSFLADVQRELPREFVRIDKVVDPVRVEPTAMLLQLEEMRLFPAILFERPKNLKGEISSFNLLMNFGAGQSRVNLAMGLSPGAERVAMLEEYLARERSPLNWEVVSPNQAPVREVVLTGGQVDLAELPIVRHHEMEGPHLDMVVAAKDLWTGRYNLSWHRAQYLDRNHLALHMSRYHLWTYFQKAESAGRNLPIAYILGHHPTFYIASTSTTPMNGPDEYRVAGAVMGAPLRLVPSVTYGEELLVPADAEIVLEGELVAGKRAVEAPFGEMSRTYGPQKLSNLFEVKAITHQRDPIMMCMFSAHPGGAFGINQAHEAGLMDRIRAAIPGVREVAKWTYKGGAGFIAIISMKKLTEGDQGRAAAAALADLHIKIVILVDEDIDPYNMGEVMWAVAERVQPHNDVTVLPPIFKTTDLDPSTEFPRRTSAMIIDATKPLNAPFQRQVSIPESTMDRIKLEDYIPPEVLQAIPSPRDYPMKSYL